MSDEQLQSLFAGMGRHLDRRVDGLEGRLDGLEKRLGGLEQSLDKRIDEMAIRMEAVETRLLTEFHKWASPAEARARAHTANLQALDLELELLKDRVKKLEGAQSNPS